MDNAHNAQWPMGRYRSTAFRIYLQTTDRIRSPDMMAKPTRVNVRSGNPEVPSAPYTLSPMGSGCA
eukprot:34548-Prymnesium_polylepis.2